MKNGCQATVGESNLTLCDAGLKKKFQPQFTISEEFNEDDDGDGDGETQADPPDNEEIMEFLEDVSNKVQASNFKKTKINVKLSHNKYFLQY